MYIYQQKKWPHFYYDAERLADLLALVDFERGKLLGKMQNLGFELRQESLLETLSLEIVKSSEIEGEIFNVEQVRSSVADKLNIHYAKSVPYSHHIAGVVDMMLDATRLFDNDLTESRLFSWHATLFPTGYSGLYQINVANFRDDKNGVMQVVSTKNGKETVYFEAPPATDIKPEMDLFFNWINDKNKMHPLIKTAIAHLWFLTIHPFDDGNGRMARAITEMMLARADKTQYRFYSASSQILLHKKQYYTLLEQTQKGSLDITIWIDWFLKTILKSIESADKKLAKIVYKSKFWQHHQTVALDESQIKMVNLLLDDFKGHLTTAKWAKICKTSPDTALRSIKYLIENNILMSSGQGRGTHYILKTLVNFK